MTLTGMDIEAVQQLAARMDENAGQIDQLVGTLTQALLDTQWVGQDRERFVGDWDGQFVPQLKTVAQSLRDTATAARQNAEEQQQASA